MTLDPNAPVASRDGAPGARDAAARETIRTALDRTLVVEAAAGTGKTTALVGRVLALLRTGAARLSGLVAVTFTDKAAGEMKLRLRGELESARLSKDATPDERARLDAAVEELETAHIGTIHGFCTELLRQRPIEACVDPAFEVVTDESGDRLYEEAFTRWFESVLVDPPEGVRRLLRRRGRSAEDGARSALANAGRDLLEQRDFSGEWRRASFDRAGAIDLLLEEMRALAAIATEPAAPNNKLLENLHEMRRFLEELDRREALDFRPPSPALPPLGGGRERDDYDGLEEQLRSLKRWGAWWARYGRLPRGAPSQDEVVRARDAFKQRLDETLARCDADLAACLHRDLQPLVAAYEERKRRAGKLDFLDLLLFSRDLLRDRHDVRRAMQARITHVLVDEFQDTDPLQAEILLLLCADDANETNWERVRPVAGKLFVVGDPKQAIYRFRRADVTLYERVKSMLRARGADVLQLTTSFRAAPSIQRAINAAFAPLMQPTDDGTQAAYVPLDPFREEPTNRPTVIALPVPRPYGDRKNPTKKAVSESLPDAVGAFVHWLLRQSGWTIRENGAEVKIEARHVALLFKQLVHFGSDVTRDYVRALEARHVPHVLVGGRSFHAREEVLALRTALTAIEWPDDELSVFATLRGPFFALSDEQLLIWREDSRLKRFHPLRPLDDVELDAELAPIREALSVLARLHRGRNRRPIADTVTQLLEATRAHAGLAIWPAGEQALANVLHVVEAARRFEAAGATSFRAFVEKLSAEAERGGAAEAPAVEEGTDGVRIMTVHRAKGLEFPIVLLVDPTCPPTRNEPTRFVDASNRLWVRPLAGCVPTELVERREEILRHDRAEAIRHAYVAATRARDLLVVPVVGDAEIGGWVDVLHPALYPERSKRRVPSPAIGCPTFGDDSVLERPYEASGDRETSVCPGAHQPMAGDHTVVWWDPRALQLGVEEDAGVRQQWVLDGERAPEAAEEGKRAHAAWNHRKNEAISTGRAPTRVVRTATSIERATPGAMVDKARVAIDRASRPRGKRFGALVHAALATIDLRRADDASVRAAARVQARTLGAPTEEIEAAVVATLAALAHPLFVRARAARLVRRESPILLREDDGAITEGILDLAFLDADGWTVVDFKTDAADGARADAYAAQLTAYVRAVALATGLPTRGVLFEI